VCQQQANPKHVFMGAHRPARTSPHKLPTARQELEASVRASEARLAAARESVLERGKTGYVRLAAEVDNYRKRRGADKESLQRDAIVRVLK
jgi:molecular chaperone GrpE (heat shock protein)